MGPVRAQHVARDAVNIGRRIGGADHLSLGHPSCDAVQRLVGQVLGEAPTLALEELHESPPGRLVSLAGAAAIGIEQVQQALEGLLVEGHRLMGLDAGRKVFVGPSGGNDGPKRPGPSA